MDKYKYIVCPGNDSDGYYVTVTDVIKLHKVDVDDCVDINSNSASFEKYSESFSRLYPDQTVLTPTNIGVV